MALALDRFLITFLKMLHMVTVVAGFLVSPCFGCEGDGVEEPGQPRGCGQRVLRDARPVLPTPPDAGRGHQRPRHREAELRGHLEVPPPAAHTSSLTSLVVLCFIWFIFLCPASSLSPFDKDDQTSCTSTVSKRLLSNQSPPDTPSMREQVFYVSHNEH